MADAKKVTAGIKTVKNKKNNKKKKKRFSKQTGRWGGHKFVVSRKLVRPFDDLQITGSSETEDKKKDGQIYVARKNARPTEVTMTVILHAYTGCDVRKESLSFVNDARKGKNDYFYVGRKKLTTYKLLLTEATVKEIEIAPGGTWVSSEIQLTLKQTGTGGTSVNSSKSGSGGGGGSSGGGGGGTYSSAGSQKTSVNTSSTTTKVPPVTVTAPVVAAGAAAAGVFGVAANAIKNAITGGTSSGTKAAATKSASSTVKKTISSAKTYSSAAKSGGGSGGTVSRAALY